MVIFPDMSGGECGTPGGTPLVAHRGYAARYPENTRESLAAAVSVGAEFVEFDIQLSADGVPVLLHDADLDRTAGRRGTVFDLSAVAGKPPDRNASRARVPVVLRLPAVAAADAGSVAGAMALGGL